jgi:hypothetical protein
MTVRRFAEPRARVTGQSETEDQLLGMITALAAQLAVTRERLDTVERLAHQPPPACSGPRRLMPIRPRPKRPAHAT